MTDEQFITFVSPNKFITVELNQFPGGARPIRWKNQGLTGYVGVDKVANLLDVLRDQTKQHHYNTPKAVKIWWSETMSSPGNKMLDDSGEPADVNHPEQPED